MRMVEGDMVMGRKRLRQGRKPADRRESKSSVADPDRSAPLNAMQEVDHEA